MLNSNTVGGHGKNADNIVIAIFYSQKETESSSWNRFGYYVSKGNYLTEHFTQNSVDCRFYEVRNGHQMF